MSEHQEKQAIDASKEEDQQQLERRRAAGEFVRGVSGFRNAIGQTKDFPAELGRYHLFVALNCPWCHRVGSVAKFENVGLLAKL